MKVFFITLAVLGIFSVSARDAEAPQVVHAEKQVQQPAPKAKKPKAQTKWSELTLQQKIKKNPRKCNLRTHYIMDGTKTKPDGWCKKKVPIQAKATPKPVATTVQPTGSCHDWMRQAGITDMVNAYTIIMRESGCNPHAQNPSSGAGGIPQALPYSKTGCAWGDPICQLKWMEQYVQSRYGGWVGAVSFWNSNHWY